MAVSLDKVTLEKRSAKPVVTEPLESVSILRHLATRGVSEINKIHIFSSVESTNDYLLENQSDGNQLSVCLAEQQTQGRGRYGHQWDSPAGVNIYMSMSWPTRDLHKQYDVLSLWLLLAIAEVLERYGVNDAQLKWPNDVCIGNKKIAGVLLERKFSQNKSNVVLGVGLNVAMSLHDNIELDNPWTDLITVNPDWNISRNEIAADLLAAFYKLLNGFEKGELKDLGIKWRRYDMLLDKPIEFQDGEDKCDGIVVGINENGQLLLNQNGILKSLHSSQAKEIKII